MGGVSLARRPPKLIAPTAPAKPSGTQEEVVLLIGDSFGAQGESVSLLTGDTWNQNGTPYSGPTTVTLCSIAKGFYDRMKELRPSAPIHVFQHAVSTIDLETIFLSYWPLVRDRALAAGKTPTVLLICAGTNSSGTGESAVVPGYLDTMYRAWQARFPGLRIVHLGPYVEETNAAPGGLPAQARPEAELVRGYIAAACDGRTRHYLNGQSYTGHSDEIHLLASSYTTAGRDGCDDYYNGS